VLDLYPARIIGVSSVGGIHRIISMWQNMGAMDCAKAASMRPRIKTGAGSRRETHNGKRESQRVNCLARGACVSTNVDAETMAMPAEKQMDC
jgi:hypothetical protein